LRKNTKKTSNREIQRRAVTQSAVPNVGQIKIAKKTSDWKIKRAMCGQTPVACAQSLAQSFLPLSAHPSAGKVIIVRGARQADGKDNQGVGVGIIATRRQIASTLRPKKIANVRRTRAKTKCACGIRTPQNARLIVIKKLCRTTKYAGTRNTRKGRDVEMVTIEIASKHNINLNRFFHFWTDFTL
jgi:hypothetical protein